MRRRETRQPTPRGRPAAPWLLLAALAVASAGAQVEDEPLLPPVDPEFERIAEAGASPTVAKSFEQWLAGVRAEAEAQGISSATLDRTLAGLRPSKRVVELDRRQTKSTLTFRTYLRRTVPASRVGHGRQMLVRHRELLEEIGKQYGVDPSIIVALWGIESDFGRNQGNHEVLPALAALAYDGRRGRLFRGELLDALRMVDGGHVQPERLRGSWAGALGQCQFMPSSFARYAVDHDGDGRRDIWDTPADIFASTANYLSSQGWQADLAWGRVVVLPRGLDPGLAGLDRKQPVSAWSKLGVRPVGAQALPEDPDTPAALVLPDGSGGPAYLVYGNFDVLRTWNRSTYFAVAIGILSDRIGW